MKLGGSATLRETDLGFKVFKLAGSNFKVWEAGAAPADTARLAEQLQLMAANVEPGRADEALLYELVLKSNLPLTSKITAGKIGAQTFYDVANGTLAICLERPVTQETLRGLIARQPRGVICLDVAFAGQDQLKANIVLESDELESYVSRLLEVGKSLYDVIEYESKVEHEFARALDAREDIKLFFKLPDWFKVETPLGTYNPDWAIVREEPGGRNKVYLVRETKGTTEFLKIPENQRKKIQCGKAHFKAVGLPEGGYDWVQSAREV